MSNKRCENSAGVLKNKSVVRNILRMVKDSFPALLTYHLMNCIVSPLVLTLFFRNICEGWYESIASFFSDTIISIIMKYTYILGASFMELRLYFQKISFIFNILFSPLRKTQHFGHLKFLLKCQSCLHMQSFSSSSAKQRLWNASIWGLKKDGSWMVLNQI